MAPAAPLSSASILAMSSGAISKSNTSTLETIRSGVADFGRGLNLWRNTRPQKPRHGQDARTGDAPFLQRPADEDLRDELIVLPR